VNYAARTRLDCPDTQGELTRASIAPDGKSCLYKSGDVEVNVQLTPVSGDAYATLRSIETSLVGEQTAAAQAANADAGKAQKAASAAQGAAAKAAQDAAADAGARASTHDADHDSDWNSGDKGGVAVDSNGKHVHVEGGDHDHAHVSLPGVHIDADDDNANIDVAGIHINANEGQQTVRIMHDVRLRGQPFSRERRGLRATFISQQDNQPGGYRFVGYEASGPKAGPLTVAIVKSHDEIDNGNRLYHDIERLVRRNGGA
jgi:hypothetical protein